MITIENEYLDLIGDTTGYASLEEDWDGEGAAKVRPESIEKTVKIIKMLVALYPSLPSLDIGPCADGTLDLYWKEDGFSLLINVGDNINYYGEKSGGTPKVKGDFPLNAFDFISTLIDA